MEDKTSLDEMIETLEDAREFILRFDDPDDEEIAMSKRISALLKRVGEKSNGQ